MNSFASFLSAILVVLLLAEPATAALVDIETQRLKYRAKESAGELAAAADRSEGNSDSLSWKLGGLLYNRSSELEKLVWAEREWREGFGVKNLDRGRIQARIAWPTTQSIQAEGYFQGEGDRLRRLSWRALYGGGARFRLADSEPFAVYAGTGALYTEEVLDPRPDVTDSGRSSAVRGIVYLSGLAQLDKNLSLSAVAYYLPVWNLINDHRIIFSPQLIGKINDRFSVAAVYLQMYDSQPPQKTQNADQSYGMNISYTF